MKTYTKYEDPGHGWLCVGKRELYALYIAHKISPYSFMNDKYAFLEEDNDMPLFIAAKKAKGKPIDYHVEYMDDFDKFSLALNRYQYEEGIGGGLI